MNNLRKSLIWFACGAASTAAISVLATVLLKDRTEEARPYLFVQSRDPSSLPDKPGEAEEKPEADLTDNARLLYECGARQLHTFGPFPDGGDYALLPLTKENYDVSECVIKRGVTEGFLVRFIMTDNIYQAQ